MATLTVQPHPEVFFTIPHFHDAFEEFRRKKVDTLVTQLGQIFVRHNLHKHFGLSMVHRHFDMSPRQILVEAINPESTRSIFLPWDYDGGENIPKPSDLALFNEYATEKCAQDWIVPQNWIFSSSGKLIPFEFLATNDSSLPNPSEEFAIELFTALKDLGVERVVGVRRLDHIEGKTCWETTPPGITANVVVFGKEKPEELKDEEMVRVLWSFDGEGQLRQGEAWCGVCNNCVWCNR